MAHTVGHGSLGIVTIPSGADVCEWCGEPAVTRILIREPQIKRVGGVPTMIREGLWVPVCDRHRYPYRETDPVVKALIRKEDRIQAQRRQMVLEDVLPVEE